MAVSAHTKLTFAPSASSEIRLESANFPHEVRFDLRNPAEQSGQPDQPEWSRYPRAAALALGERVTRGIDGFVEGTLPGAGLSSSASVLLAYLTALADANGLELTAKEKAELAAHVDGFVVVSNRRFYDAFAAGAGTRAHTNVDVLNDGATTNATRLGAVLDLALALRECPPFDGPVLVAGGDNLFQMAFDAFFDDYHGEPRTLVLRYRESSIDKCRQTGIAEISADDGRIVKLWEKPDEPPTPWACPAFYILEPEAIEALGCYIAENSRADALGGFIGWLAERSPVYTHEMQGTRLDVGDLDGYASAENWMKNGV